MLNTSSEVILYGKSVVIWAKDESKGAIKEMT